MFHTYLLWTKKGSKLRGNIYYFSFDVHQFRQIVPLLQFAINSFAMGQGILDSRLYVAIPSPWKENRRDRILNEEGGNKIDEYVLK